MEQKIDTPEVKIPTITVEPTVLLDAFYSVIPKSELEGFAQRDGRMFTETEEEEIKAAVYRKFYNLMHAAKLGGLLIAQSCLQSKKAARKESGSIDQNIFTQELQTRLILNRESPRTKELQAAIYHSFEFLETESEQSIIGRIHTPREVHKLIEYCEQRKKKYLDPITTDEIEIETFIRHIRNRFQSLEQAGHIVMLKAKQRLRKRLVTLLQIMGEDNKVQDVEVDWIINLKQLLITVTAEKHITSSNAQFITDCALAEVQAINTRGKLMHVSVHNNECTCVLLVG